MSFSSWLSTKMDEHHINQTDLATRLGLTRGAVNNLLSGRSKNPSSDTIEKLSDIFHVPVEEIYRAAGLISPIAEKEAWLKRIEHKISRLPNDEARRIVEGTIDLLVPDKMPPKDTRVKK